MCVFQVHSMSGWACSLVCALLLSAIIHRLRAPETIPLFPVSDAPATTPRANHFFVSSASRATYLNSFPHPPCLSTTRFPHFVTVCAKTNSSRRTFARVDQCRRSTDRTFMPQDTTLPSSNSDHQSNNTNSPSTHDDHPRIPFLGHNTDRTLLAYMIAVVGGTIAVLFTDWDVDSDRPLRAWLIANALLTMLRTVGRITMHSFPRHRLNALRLTLIWTLRVLTIASIAWFVVGIVFLSGERSAKETATFRLMLVLIILELAFLGLCGLLAIIIFLFALRPVLAAHRKTPAATKEDLSKLRTFKFVEPETSCDTAATCTICLSEYQKDDVLRELPCATGNHVFHAECVDAWLTKNLSCPICRDDPLRKSKAPEQEADPPV